MKKINYYTQISIHILAWKKCLFYFIFMENLFKMSLKYIKTYATKNGIVWRAVDRTDNIMTGEY
jgi:hypothetical protein